MRITGQKGDDGAKFSTNMEASGRYHTDWLNMMFPRLRLARNLLTNDGVIFISIDDNEVENLKKLCNEVFGESNFVAQLIWQRAFSPKNDAKFISNSHDYILMFTKSINNFMVGRLERTEEADARYSNPDNDSRGVWMSSDISVKTYNTENDYQITAPSGRVIEPPAGRCWSLSKNAFFERLQDNRIWFGPDGNGTPRIKRFLTDLRKEGMTPTSILLYKDVGHSQEGAQEVVSLFDGYGLFDGPKPIRLMSRLLTLANTENDSIILDFFSGSASLAHAVMKLNTENNGFRKFLMVQIAEETDIDSKAYKAGYKNICEIGKERIRRAGDKIKEEAGFLAQNLDIGFKVFKLDTSNVKKWNAEATFDLTEEKQLRFNAEKLEEILQNSISNFVAGRTEMDVVYEIMLKMGLDLTYPVEEIEIDSKKVYSIGLGALMICIDDKITTAVADGIVKLFEEKKPETWKVVFKDNGFTDDSAKTNVREILKCAGLDEDAFTTL